jgi:hypothetical protein
MQTRTVSTGPGVEIACDESGFSGRNLVRTDTRVFAHASVRLPADAAAWCIGEIRDRARDPTPEYKSGHLLRERDRSLLQWFLGARGPLAGNAHVHLTDKTFFVVGRAISLLVGDAADPVALGLRPDRHADDLAVTLHREGPAAFGPSRWQAFLDAANRLVNGRRTPDATAPVDAFFATLGDLRAAAPPGRAGEIVRLLSRSGMNRTRARLLGDPTSVPALDPFVPAIVAAVVHWSATAGPVVIVHDEQSALSRRRIAQLQQILDRPWAAGMHWRGAAMSGLRGADSRTDPRVQIADLLAGLARKIASDALAGRADPQLTTLLRPYVDSRSIWPNDPG